MPAEDNDWVRIYRDSDVLERVQHRSGERKLGQSMVAMNVGAQLADLSYYSEKGVEYALLGIPESIGILANHGRCCADRAWDCFLRFFLNMQSNRFLSGENIVCLGHIDAEDLSEAASRLNPDEPHDMDILRQLCARLDERVFPVIEAVVGAGLVPIVIGGGHNNCYPIITGVVRALGADQGMNCINLDPHADFRPLEGRHSGNGFSYACDQGYLHRYYIVGLQEAYNSEAMLARLAKTEHVGYDFFDAPEALPERIDRAIEFCGGDDRPLGLELDLDALANMPSSAVSPSGWGIEDARVFVRKLARRLNPVYLHLPEGAPAKRPEDDRHVGKALAYLVRDFIKARTQKKRS